MSGFSIRRVTSDPDAPLPDYKCADCGQEMLSIYVGADRVRRCGACHEAKKKEAK